MTFPSSADYVDPEEELIDELDILGVEEDADDNGLWWDDEYEWEVNR